MNIPRHRELLRLIIGQPAIMCIFAAVILLGVSFASGVAQAVYQLWRDSGFTPFLPSENGWKAAILAGFSVGLFNIACDSVEIDVQQGRKRHSLTTWTIFLFSCSLMVGAVDFGLMDHAIHEYFRSTVGGIVVGTIISAIGLRLLKMHRRSISDHVFS